MRRAQAESSFQWVFVLVAGTSLLLLLFFFARSCAAQGEQETAGLSMLATAQRIERVSWQPDGSSDLFVGAARVSCTSGRVTFTSESGAASLERASAFLPPELSGDLTAVIRRITISESNSPAIELGSMLYGIDASTHYLIISDLGSYPALEEIIPAKSRTILPSDDLVDPSRVAQDIPRSTRTLIVVSNKNEGHVQRIDLSDISEATDVRGVFVGSNTASFYERKGDRLARTQDVPIEHELLALGAAISGDASLYTCGHRALQDRSLMLARLYGLRAQALADDLAAGSCTNELRDASGILLGATDLAGLLAKQRSLSGLQLALLNKACPVIA